jgi:hypothetical protein
VLKIPDPFGPLGAGIHGQVLLGSLVSGVSACLAIRILVRYFEKPVPLHPSCSAASWPHWSGWPGSPSALLRSPRMGALDQRVGRSQPSI